MDSLAATVAWINLHSDSESEALTHVGQKHQDGALAESHIMVVPLEKFEVAMEKPVPFTLVVRGDEELANFIELHDVDIGSFGGVVTAILRSPQGGTIILPWQANQTG